MDNQQKEFAKQLMKDLGYNDKDPRHWVKKAKETINVEKKTEQATTSLD